jgi:Na+-driven multidrug efflux pump
VVYGEVIVEWRSRKHFEELNAILDLLMIYGLLGVPRLELVGATLATVVLNAVSILMQLFFLRRSGLTPSLNPRSGYFKEGVKSRAFSTS